MNVIGSSVYYPPGALGIRVQILQQPLAEVVKKDVEWTLLFLPVFRLLYGNACSCDTFLKSHPFIQSISSCWSLATHKSLICQVFKAIIKKNKPFTFMRKFEMVKKNQKHKKDLSLNIQFIFQSFKRVIQFLGFLSGWQR